MVPLTSGIRESPAAAKLAFFAMSAMDRTPGVVPIAAFRVLDDATLLSPDLFFDHSNHVGEPEGRTLLKQGEGRLPDQWGCHDSHRWRNPGAGCGLGEGDSDHPEAGGGRHAHEAYRCMYTVIPGAEPGKKVL